MSSLDTFFGKCISGKTRVRMTWEIDYADGKKADDPTHTELQGIFLEFNGVTVRLWNEGQMISVSAEKISNPGIIP